MSHLQRVAAKINWLLGYRLHSTATYDLTKEHLGFQVSDQAIYLMNMRNITTRQLRAQLKEDYERYAVSYRAEQKEILADFDKHSKLNKKTI